MQILPTRLKALIQNLTILPGVGPKSAQRMALHILQNKKTQAQQLSESIQDCLQHMRQCQQCNSLCDAVLCCICQDQERDHSLICVVESLSDLISIEQTGIYRGIYFVLSGHLSPIEQIGPEQLNIPTLLSHIHQQDINELILATNATIEGEATAHFIVSHIEKKIKISRLASGIPVGTELEFLNNNTLHQALSERKEIEL
jgi:recombination protein RecR